MFKKYTSIENSYRKEYLYRIKSHEYWDRTYAVQEKVHGSNISFITTDGLNFNAAKRTALLEKDEKFYNFQLVLDQHIDRFRSIFNAVKSKFENTTQLTIFGEICGGSYSHDEVKKNNKAIKVQKGIFYSPNNEFYAFDIQINGEKFLDVEYINSLFEEHEILHAKTLFKGSLKDCLEYPNKFSSTIPSLLGLPEIEPNNCEGVIIKPLETLYFKNGVRVILKNKNDKWSENSKKIKKVSKESPFSDQVQEFQKIIKSYVTQNRLNNVLSKLGDVDISDFGKAIGDFNRDIIEDFTKDYETQLSSFDKKERKQITKSIVGKSSNMIRDYFYNQKHEL